MIYGEKLKNAVISIATSGDNIVITAPSRGYIAVDNLNLVPDAAVGLKLISGTTDLSGVYSLTSNQGFYMDNSFGNQDGVITCKNEEALIINLDGAIQCSGFIRYRIIGE